MNEALTRVVVAEDLEPTARGRKRGRKLRAYAAGLAGKLGLPLALVHAMDFQRLAREPFQIPGSFERHVEGQETRLKTIAAGLGRKAVSAVFLYGHPVETLLKHLESVRPGLLVVGTHGLKGLKHLLLGSVAEELVRRAKVPVLVLGPRAKVGTGHGHEIFVATALDKSSLPAEQLAVKLARKMKSSLRLYHCVNATLPVAAFADPAIAGSLAAYSRLLEELMKDRKKALHVKAASIRSKGVACTTLLDLRSQNPVTAILKESKGSGLVVLGRHTRGRLAQTFFGSTARAVFLQSTVPVISVAGS